MFSPGGRTPLGVLNFGRKPTGESLGLGPQVVVIAVLGGWGWWFSGWVVVQWVGVGGLSGWALVSVVGGWFCMGESVVNFL